MVEGMFPAFSHRRNRWQHDLRNIFIGVSNYLILSLLFSGALIAVMSWAYRHNFGLLYWLPIAAEFKLICALIIFDAWQYGWHRLNHKWTFLWRFHRVHHSDADMDASTALRFHPGELILSACARLAILPLLGLQVEHLLIYELILLPLILFHHANIRLPVYLDQYLRLVIVTPAMHQVHHSNCQEETDSNYASILSCWDRLFASYRYRDSYHTLQLGLAGIETQQWNRLSGIYKMPWMVNR